MRLLKLNGPRQFNQAVLLTYINYKDEGQSTAVGSNRIACYIVPQNN